MGRLDGKVAIISGGARGFGATESRLFAREGAKVVIADILDGLGKQVEAEIAGMGGEATFVHLDVTSEAQWDNAVQTAVNAYGKLNILVNNAGIALQGRVEETTEEEWDRVLDVNAKGVFLGTKAVIPGMQEVGGGSIVNISSIAGLVGSQLTAYSASKGAVRLLTKSTAIQYAEEKIRCNSVHPGIMITDMTTFMREDPEVNSRSLARIPMGHYGTVEDVANGVLFLASDESAYMTGSELVIDGGITAQ